MATVTEWKTTADGKKQYRIYVSRGRGNGKLSMLWTAPDGWSKRAIDRELIKVSAEFERKVKAGEVISREEVRKAAERAAEEEAKIQTLQQFGEQVFMPTMQVSCSEHTRDSYQRNLDKHIYPVLGKFKLPSITSNMISAMLLNLQTPKDGDKPLKHASVIKVYQITSQIFKMAYLNHTIDRNPMDFVSRPKPSKTEKLDTAPQSFSAEEMNYIFACLAKEPLKWQTYIRLLADTGARKGEICGLQWSDIDFKEKCITIRHNLCYTPQNGVYLDTPKSGKERVVYVDDDVLALVKRLRIQQNSENVIQLSKFVFTQDGTQEPMHPDTPTRYCKKFGQRYGVADFHPHKLRHSFASIAITYGADIASVSEKLGHADKATTLRMYTHSDAEAQKRASDIFRSALKAKQA